MYIYIYIYDTIFDTEYCFGLWVRTEACTLANLLLKMGRFQRALMLVVPARRLQALNA